jgi:hypothetical protein
MREVADIREYGMVCERPVDRFEAERKVLKSLEG